MPVYYNMMRQLKFVHIINIQQYIALQTVQMIGLDFLCNKHGLNKKEICINKWVITISMCWTLFKHSLRWMNEEPCEHMAIAQLEFMFDVFCTSCGWHQAIKCQKQNLLNGHRPLVCHGSPSALRSWDVLDDWRPYSVWQSCRRC